MFQTRTESAEAWGLLTLRVAVGDMMMTHGIGALTLGLTGAGRLSTDALIVRRRQHGRASD
jgi:uncharacterized membrane protein YphA (DoxX/SURF4 family)